MVDLASIQKKIISFRNERDWTQFHDSKNIAEALFIEVGGLLENFLCKTTAVPQSFHRTTQVSKKDIRKSEHDC